MRQVTLHLEVAFRGLPVQATEGHLLSFLARYSPTSCGELRRVFGVKPSTLTSLLDRLVARDLATREVDADDRRSFLVAPTAEGRRLARRIDRNVRAFEGRLRARVSEVELRGFQAVMDAIAAETAVEVRAPRPRAPLED